MQHYIEFNGYHLLQDDRFLKLTQDTALLSDFINLKKNDVVLDVGAGVGSLGLLLCIKNMGQQVDGIEIVPEAAEIARKNYTANGFGGQIYTADLKTFSTPDRYTVCVSNPPYFAPARGKTAQVETVATARAEEQAHIADVCAMAKRVLKWGGRFYFCYKPERLDNAMKALHTNNFAVKRLQFVHQTAEKPANLVLIEARFGGGEWCHIAPPIFIKNDGREIL